MLKVGILGGGQLGRMLLQTAANYPVETFVLENDKECPAAHLCHHFTKGSSHTVAASSFSPALICMDVPGLANAVLT